MSSKEFPLSGHCPPITDHFAMVGFHPMAEGTILVYNKSDERIAMMRENDTLRSSQFNRFVAEAQKRQQ